jgi:hypothetical protein
MGDRSAFELAALLALCLLAGLGAGLAFESALLGLIVAGAGLIAVAAYGAATRLRPWPRPRRLDPHRLSVTEIATRRREAKGRAESRPAPTPQTDTAAEFAASADPDRIVPFRAPSTR